MRTLDKDKDLKYYDVYITGRAKLDANNNPVVNADGSYDIDYCRTSTQTSDMLKAGIPGGRFFQTSMVENNVKANTIQLPDGTIAELGSLVDRGITVNVFEARQSEPFKDLINAVEKSKVELIVPPKGKTVNPVGKVKAFLQPGLQLPYETGFEYYRHRRDPVDHIDKAQLFWAYDDKGKMTQQKRSTNRGQLFLFGNQFDAVEALIKTQINQDAKFKVPLAVGIVEGAQDHSENAEPEVAL
jgi:hypothetical protein